MPESCEILLLISLQKHLELKTRSGPNRPAAAIGGADLWDIWLLSSLTEEDWDNLLKLIDRLQMASESRSDLINGFDLANFTYLPNIRSHGHPKGLKIVLSNFVR